MFKEKFALEVSLLPGRFDQYLEEAIQQYGLFNPDGSLSEEKMLFIESMTLRRAHTIATEFHRKKCSLHMDTLKQLLEEAKARHLKLIHKKLVTIIKAEHAAILLPNIPVVANSEYFKKRIKEYSHASRGGINKDAIILFLRHYVFMYRSGLNQQPLQQFLTLLETNVSFNTWLTKGLRDKAYAQHDEYWNSGNHEWLPCHLIVEAIKRSADLVVSVKPYVVTYNPNNCSIMDWLMVHAELRSPVKRIYFKNDVGTIESGHTPAIRSRLNSKATIGTQTTGTHCFHEDLDAAFYASRNPREFIRSANLITNKHLVSGKKHIPPSDEHYYTVEGVKTDDEKGINELRHAKIRPAYHGRKNLMTLFSQMAESGIDGENIASPSTTDTEYTSSEEEPLSPCTL